VGNRPVNHKFRATVCWIFPDRSSARQRQWEDERYWNDYRAAAASRGLDVAVHDPGSVVVDAISGVRAEVFVDGEPVSPVDTIFVTELYTFPHQIPDTFKQISVFTVLQQLGFYLPVPPRLSLIANDKMATALYLADCPIPPVPTFRFGTGRDDSITGAASLAELPYPVVVKSAGWGGGLGVFVAENERQVRTVASLASGSDCDLVCQPYLGEGTTDYRLYFVDGRVHTTLRRVPRSGEVVANVARGGRPEYLDLPVELAEAADYLARKFPIPYFCADFLFDGLDFHLSEVELDGAYVPDHAGPDHRIARGAVHRLCAAARAVPRAAGRAGRVMSFAEAAVERRDVEMVRELVERVRAVPALSSRYADDTDVVSNLPVMTKREFRPANDNPAPDQGPWYVFASGGTTQKPSFSRIPSHMFVDDIRMTWSPLSAADTFMNLFAGGKLWSSHYFHNEFAARSGSSVVAVGSIAEHEVDSWMEGSDIAGLMTTADRRRITGVTVRGPDGHPQQITADLVVDATGRGSRAPIWLREWGYCPPAEDRIDIRLGYATGPYGCARGHRQRQVHRHRPPQWTTRGWARWARWKAADTSSPWAASSGTTRPPPAWSTTRGTCGLAVVGLRVGR
jgi:glutathione synthase/RimK-type ligase-like ATP-grasp enzyme